jgi:hypothetical protein
MDASAIVASEDLTMPVDHAATSVERTYDLLIPSVARLPGEELWSAPELFFESEEEIKEPVDAEGGIEKGRSSSTYVGSTAFRPLVYSINDPSAVVGRGRHFHSAPPMRVVLGVFRV